MSSSRPTATSRYKRNARRCWRGFVVQLAQPVPEPSAWRMLGVGLAGLGLYSRRRKAG